MTTIRVWAVAADRELLGREDELARLSELVSALPNGPRAITLRGEPGIGKTTVWRAGLALRPEPCTLLSARCVEAELPLALVGLSDLVRDAFRDVDEELADHDRAVLAATLGLEAPGQGRAALALPLAFLAFLRLLGREGPVLVAVDDVQWLDPSSARILSFAARRLGDLPIGILVAQRGDGPDRLDLRNALGVAHEELRLGPLSRGALAHLVRSRADVPLPRAVFARVYEASGGNPMFALEFARSLDRDRPQLGPITIPSSLQDLVRARVERYPKDVRRMLAIVAAAERITAPVLAAVDPSAPKLLAAAVDLDAVAIEDDGLIRFTHPLLGSAAYGDLAPAARRSLHAELAQRIRGRGGPGAALRACRGRTGSCGRGAARRSRGPRFGARSTRGCRRAGTGGAPPDPSRRGRPAVRTHACRSVAASGSGSFC